MSRWVIQSELTKLSELNPDVADVGGGSDIGDMLANILGDVFEDAREKLYFPDYDEIHYCLKDETGLLHPICSFDCRFVGVL